jgi:sulfur-carrier protein adenylyltransferase/sulfurtransferase
MYRHNLSQDEIKRYHRQIVLPELGVRGQEKIKQSKVLVVGAGGLGSPILLYLAAAGIGHIGIVDADVVEISNLHRQILYKETDMGKLKTIQADAAISALNPHLHITPHSVKLNYDNVLSIIAEYEVIVDGSDNYVTCTK